MIVVIADDLTGAAELGGIGLRYGLSVEIVLDPVHIPAVDLLIIALDTRSMTEAEALLTMRRTTAFVKEINPEFIYKKVDSVLRGHVFAELNVHLYELGLTRAILVPANPAMGRTIRNGSYFINDQPIHQTSFAHDPEFGLVNASVHSMLRVQDDDIHVHTFNDVLPADGIILGECRYEDDLLSWAVKADNNTLLAGGSGLFKALLTSFNLKPGKDPDIPHTKITRPALFVCGSTFNKSKQLIEQVNENNGPVSYMPQGIVSMPEPPEKLFEQWADEIHTLLLIHKKAIIAVDEATTCDMEVAPNSLREKKAKVVEKVMKKIAIKELLVEGGATGASIINRLAVNSFVPVNEFDTGVIRMKILEKRGLFLTLKPGSYNWPPHIWDF